MTDAELCRAVAVEVIKLPGGVFPDEIWVTHDPMSTVGGTLFQMGRPLQLTWNDAGRVVEAMRERGESDFCAQTGSTAGWLVSFGDCDVMDLSFPRAVFLAALQAVRGKESTNA